MSAAEVLRVVRAARVEVAAEGGDLVWTARDDPPSDLLTLLREHKAEILAAPAADPLGHTLPG